MRRIIRFGLPAATVVVLASAAFLIVQNVHAFTSHHTGQNSDSTRSAPTRSAAGSEIAHSPAASINATTEKPTSAGSSAGGSAGSVPKSTAASPTSKPEPAAPNLSSTPGLILAHGISSAPHPSHPYFLEQVNATGGLEYGTTRNRGLFISTDGGKTWEERSNGLPIRVIYPFTDDPIATLTSLGVDPRDGKRVAVTTETGVYVSSDAGRSWRSIPVHKPVKSADFITAVALSPYDKSTVAIATSFAGVFTTDDDGKTWVSRAKDLQFIYRGDGFYEEISGLSYSAASKGIVYVGVGFGGGVYRSSPDWKSWTSLHFPGEKSEVIRNLSTHATGLQSGPGSQSLDLETQTNEWKLDPSANTWHTVGPSPQPPAASPAARARMRAASGRAGIYISPWDAAGKKLSHWVSFLKANGLNTLVVDVKDDHGHITYDTKVPLAHTLGAVHPYFNLEDLIQTAHANGIYVVGRLVVFKDMYLFRYKHHRYAIWDPKRNAPWGHFVREVNKTTGKVTEVQKEFWVDPFSEFAWRYNLQIAEELQRDGIDEIQFDYIRFPSEHSSRNALYRYRRKGMTEEAALESFLKMARAALHVPIAVDLFGYNSWYPITGWVGQDIEVYSNYADVICPMFYPSLFPRDFLSGLPYLKRAKYLYRMGTWRSQRIVNGRAIIRPFVQAFLLGPYELKMDKAQYSNYLRTELEGVQDANAPGFLLWNFGTDYYMVTFPLTPYVPRRP